MARLIDFVLMGNDEMLASYLAANLLASCADKSLLILISTPECETASSELREHITALVKDGGLSVPDEEMDSRLHITYAAPENFQLEMADFVCSPEGQIWLLAGAETPADAVGELLDALSALKASTINCVVAADDSSTETRVIQHCSQNALSHRVFRTARIVGDSPFNNVHHAVLHLLDVLFEFKTEIEERLPEYFEFRSLRCVAPPQERFNLISAEEAAELMVRISRQQNSCGRYDIASLEDFSFPDLCMCISMASGFSLSVAKTPDELNAIDAILDKRLSSFREACASSQHFDPGPGHQLAGIAGSGGMSRQKLAKILAQLRSRIEGRRAALDRRCSELQSVLAANTIVRDSSELTYFIGGAQGTPVVILNALGQGLDYWGRLLNRLFRNHRIIIWQPRGTFSGPQPFTMVDQVEDLKAILREEKISNCHLAGWCTGPKVALEFYFQEPQTVSTMVFLNGSFKCTGTPRELQSVYEQQLDSLCQALDDAPDIASSVIRSLTSGLEVNLTDLMEMDSRECAVQVLALINQHLKQHVLAPFRDENTVLNYARQLLDFWNYDQTSRLGDVQVPVLLLSAEYDQVAAPAMIRSISELLPQAHLVHVKGATHYCLYDRPDFVADLMEAFFRDPRLQEPISSPKSKEETVLTVI